MLRRSLQDWLSQKEKIEYLATLTCINPIEWYMNTLELINSWKMQRIW